MATNEEAVNEPSPDSEASIEAVYPPDYQAGVAELAYYKAERRDFEPGYELEDWLEAEQEYLLGGKQ